MEKFVHDLGFKRSSYGIFTFVDFANMRLSIDWSNLFFDQSSLAKIE